MVANNTFSEWEEESIISQQYELTSVSDEEVLGIISRELINYVTQIPFDNLAVVLSWLSAYDPSVADLQQAWEEWEPDSVGFIDAYGGTNCVGATEVLRQRLEESDINYQVIISTSNNLPEGANYIEVPFQHMALIVNIGNVFYLVEPGLGIVAPIPTDTNSVEIANRVYTAKASESTAELVIRKPDGSTINCDFIYLDTNANPESLLQKPLLRATTTFKIETFSIDGKKLVSFKIDIYNSRISYIVNDNIHTFGFDQIDKMFNDQSFINLVNQLNHLDLDEMKDRISTTVTRRADIVDTWLEGLQKRYYLDFSEELSPHMSSWKELEAHGYFGGGVVVCLINEYDQVMMYQVPEGKSKPKINRYAGQMNLFVETADHVGDSDSVSDLEDFETNLERAFKEEIGIAVPEEFIYREVDYTPQIRARCVVCRVDSTQSETIMNHIAHRNEVLGYEEIGQVEWIDTQTIDAHWLEPNAKAIVEKLIAEGILSQESRNNTYAYEE